MYKIVMSDKVVETLKKIPKTDVNRFMRKITVIAQDPYAPLPFVKRLKNSQNYRFRFGDYRGVYNVADTILTVTVIEVGHRKEIYRR
jgi:mRNA interferase RelE/StbE